MTFTTCLTVDDNYVLNKVANGGSYFPGRTAFSSFLEWRNLSSDSVRFFGFGSELFYKRMFDLKLFSGSYQVKAFFMKVSPLFPRIILDGEAFNQGLAFFNETTVELIAELNASGLIQRGSPLKPFALVGAFISTARVLAEQKFNCAGFDQPVDVWTDWLQNY